MEFARRAAPLGTSPPPPSELGADPKPAVSVTPPEWQPGISSAAIIEGSDDAIISQSLDGIITSWNPGAERMFGYSTAEILARPIAALVPTDRVKEEAAILARIARGERVKHFETVRLGKSGAPVEVSLAIFPLKDSRGRTVGASTIARDISVLKARERELSRITRLYAALTRINQAIVRLPTESALFDEICHVLVKHGGFRTAWIGCPDPATHQLRPVSVAGADTDLVQANSIFVDGDNSGLNPAGAALRSGHSSCCNDLARDPSVLPWHCKIVRHGLQASGVFPIRTAGKVSGALIVYAHETGFFREAEISLLEEAASNVSFALDHFRLEEARQKAEITVRLERDFSDAALNSLPGVFYLYDQDRKFLRWNKNYELMTGFTAAEIATAHPLDFVREADRPEVSARIEAVFQNGESHVEVDLVSKDGRTTPYHFTGIRAEIGGKSCLLGVGIDISAQKRAERELQRGEEAQRLLALHLAKEKARLLVAQAVAKIGSWETDLVSGDVSWSDETHRIFETDPQEFRPTHSGFLERVYADDRAHLTDAFSQSLLSKDQGGAHSIEHRILSRDGRIKVVDERWRVFFDGRGEPQRAIGTCQDITERRHAETELQLLKERLLLATAAAEIGIWDWNLATGEWYATSTYSTMLGYDPARAFSGRDFWLELVHPDDRARISAKIQAAVDGSTTPYEYEARLRHADGSYRWISVTGRVLAVDAQGKASRLIGVRMDVTERRRANEELRTAERQLHALVGRLNSVREEEAKRIARELHDDLGQQLTALNMELTDLEEKLPKDFAQPRQFGRMRAGVDRTIEVVQKIAGELRLGQLDLLGLTAAIDWHLQEFSRLSGIRCEGLQLDDNDRLSDPQATALFRILQEALTNVARHAGATKVEVSLISSPHDVTLQIRDNGRGITSVQLQDTQAIGLLGMRERAEILGGDIKITSVSGAGTTVCVRIPLEPTAKN